VRTPEHQDRREQPEDIPRADDRDEATTGGPASTRVPRQETEGQALDAETPPGGSRRAEPEEVRPQGVAVLEPAATDSYRARWDAIQATFVDEPRAAVSGADALVAEVMQEMARTFAERKDRLEARWSRGNEVSTEDLRNTFRQYRSFFEAMLR
jgi:hypothetical protein